MISVIIPVYNVELYLPQCVESVLNQSYQNFELILVDDGSSDNSPAICDEYSKKDARVRVVHQKNTGVSAARNFGIEQSRGEWLTFIDSDDFVENDYLERFDVEKNNADLIIQGLEYFDNRTRIYFKQVIVDNIILPKDGLKTIVAKNKLLHSGYPVAKAYKRNLLIDNNIRFNQNISFHEDHIFVLQAMNAANGVRFVDSVAYKYRYFHSANSLSMKRHSWEQLNEASEGMLTCLEEMKDRFLEENSSYCKSVYTFAYEPKVNAVYQLYADKKNRKGREFQFKQVIKKKQVKEFFFPNDKKGKLIKAVILYLPFAIIDKFFRLVVFYQSRNDRA